MTKCKWLNVLKEGFSWQQRSLLVLCPAAKCPPLNSSKYITRFFISLVREREPSHHAWSTIAISKIFLSACKETQCSLQLATDVNTLGRKAPSHRCASCQGGTTYLTELPGPGLFSHLLIQMGRLCEDQLESSSDTERFTGQIFFSMPCQWPPMRLHLFI